MKGIVIATALASGLVASALAGQLPSAMPKLVPPVDAKLLYSHGDRSALSFAGGLAMRACYRLQTALPASGLTDQYVRQLSAAGWKPTFSQTQPSMALVRFSVGSTDAQLVGILTVVPFPETQSALIAVEILRSRPRTPMSGRAGGGGAGASTQVEIPLPDVSVSAIPFPEGVRVPPTTASRVEQLMWGGEMDSSHTETRLETFANLAELMKLMEPQITTRGWTVDVRAGDAVQSVTKFNPPKGGDSTALLLLTLLPDTGEVSVMLNVYRNKGMVTERTLR